MVRSRMVMICPTDGLESIIRKEFDGQIYFYTSLGNTLDTSASTLKEIAQFVEDNGVQEITFILSEDNRIILDAFNQQNYCNISELNEPYKHFLEYKKFVVSTWQSTHDQHAIILSHHLNQKISELESGIGQFLKHLPPINAKLYSKPYHQYRSIYPELVCVKTGILN